MTTHWGQRWLAFHRGSELVVLHGSATDTASVEMLELHLARVTDATEAVVQKPEIQ